MLLGCIKDPCGHKWQPSRIVGHPQIPDALCKSLHLSVSASAINKGVNIAISAQDEAGFGGRWIKRSGRVGAEPSIQSVHCARQRRRVVANNPVAR